MRLSEGLDTLKLEHEHNCREWMVVKGRQATCGPAGVGDLIPSNGWVVSHWGMAYASLAGSLQVQFDLSVIDNGCLNPLIVNLQLWLSQAVMVTYVTSMSFSCTDTLFSCWPVDWHGTLVISISHAGTWHFYSPWWWVHLVCRPELHPLTCLITAWTCWLLCRCL